MSSTQTDRQRQIDQHLEALGELQRPPIAPNRTWPPEDLYLLRHVVIGSTLGVLAAAASLAANVVGAPLFGKRPFELIRAYLTFPMGDRALTVEDGVVLTAGVFLYLSTGALLGIVFHLLFGTVLAGQSSARRFLVATVLGLALWIVNFYLILSWLQPLLLGGRWILELVPWWVAALTHLTFAWTFACGEAWGRRDSA